MTDARTDTITWHAHARVDKFDLEQIEACRAALGLDREPIGAEMLAFCAPRETVESEGNLLTRQGLRRVMDRLLGTAADQAQIIHQLQMADNQRACQAKTDKAAFATVLDLLAGFAGTAPYPDEERKKIVQGMRDTANLFRTFDAGHCAGG